MNNLNSQKILPHKQLPHNSFSKISTNDILASISNNSLVSPTEETHPKRSSSLQTNFATHPAVLALRNPLFSETKSILKSLHAILAVPPAKEMLAYGAIDPSFFERHVFFRNPQEILPEDSSDSSQTNLHENSSGTPLPTQLISSGGTRAVINNNRIYLIGPPPPEEQLLNQWESKTNAETTTALRTLSLWDAFPDAQQLPQVPSIQVAYPRIISWQLENNSNKEQPEKGSEESSREFIRLLLIRRPIMTDDLDHHSISSSPTPSDKQTQQTTTTTPANIPENISAIPTLYSSSAPSQIASQIASQQSQHQLPLSASNSQTNSILSLPSNMLGTINPFNALPTLFTTTPLAQPSQKPRFECPHPTLASDASITAFLSLVADPRAEIVATHVHKYLHQFNHFVSTTIAQQSSIQPRISMTDAISSHLHRYLDTFSTLLASIRFIRSQGDTYINTILDGTESYIVASHYTQLYRICLMESEMVERGLGVRMSIARVSPKFTLHDLGLSSLFTNTDTTDPDRNDNAESVNDTDAEIHRLLSNTVYASTVHLIRFTSAITRTPLRKQTELVHVHDEIVSFINAVSHLKSKSDQTSHDQLHEESIQSPASATTTSISTTSSDAQNDFMSTMSNSDTILGLLIHAILQSSPPHLPTTLLFTQKYRNPSRLTGLESYCTVNTDAAIKFLSVLDMDNVIASSQSHVTDIIDLCKLPSQSTSTSVTQTSSGGGGANVTSPLRSLRPNSPLKSPKLPASPIMMLVSSFRNRSRSPSPTRQPSQQQPQQQQSLLSSYIPLLSLPAPSIHLLSQTHPTSILTSTPSTSSITTNDLITGIATSLTDDMHKMSMRLTQMWIRGPTTVSSQASDGSPTDISSSQSTTTVPNNAPNGDPTPIDASVVSDTSPVSATSPLSVQSHATESSNGSAFSDKFRSQLRTKTSPSRSTT